MLYKPSFINSLIVSAVLLNGCSDGSIMPNASESAALPALSLTQAINANAENMAVAYQIESNTNPDICDREKADGNCFQATLSFTFSQDLPDKGWEIYFGHLYPFQSFETDAFSIEHINGDLYRLTPDKAIAAGQEYSISVIADFWSVAQSDVLPNYYFVGDGVAPVVIEATRNIADPNTSVDLAKHSGKLTSEKQYKRNLSDATELADANRIFNDNINVPVSSLNKDTKAADQYLSLSNGLQLSTQEVALTSRQQLLLEQLISTSPGAVSLSIAELPAEQLPEDAYLIDITPQGISLSVSSASGLSYALQDLYTNIENKGTETARITLGKIEEKTAFGFRGLHIDVSRNFKSATFIKQMLDEMAQLKLNKLHFHLADDEGWRLEIPHLPELTQIGGYRCHDPQENNCLLPQLGAGPHRESQVNGFYSVDEYVDILKYAAERHIEVIPSLDMPGHSRAAIVSMEARARKLAMQESPDANRYRLIDPMDTTVYRSIQYYDDNTINPCLDSSYTFVESVLDKLISYHARAGAPLKRYHIGADETAGAWKESPACQQYIAETEGLSSIDQLTAHFVSRVSDILLDKGVLPAGWSDGLSKVDIDTYPSMQVNVWDPLMWQGHKHAYHFAEHGWQTVLSFPDVYYFDFPYAAHPEEPGYYWAARETDSYKVFRSVTGDLALNSQRITDRMGHPFNAEAVTQKPAEFAGIQGHLWTEVVRTEAHAEYMLFPRLIALAHRAWYGDDESDAQAWETFAASLSHHHLPRLATKGINFRLAPPGAVINKNMLQMNHLLPDLTIEYQEQGGQWQVYSSPVAVSGHVYVRAKLPGTHHVSRTLFVE